MFIINYKIYISVRFIFDEKRGWEESYKKGDKSEKFNGIV